MTDRTTFFSGLFALLFAARLGIALWALATGYDGGGGQWWIGRATWMGYLLLYAYLPLTLVFVGYSGFLAYRKQVGDRVNLICWLLLVLAFAAELTYGLAG